MYGAYSNDSNMMTTENKTFRTKIANKNYSVQNRWKLVKGEPQKSKRS